MLRTSAILRHGDTVGRLRRGFRETQGPRAVSAMARAACFSRRQFHRLTVQVIGETPGAHQRRLWRMLFEGGFKAWLERKR